jgi:hypothetical protein
MGLELGFAARWMLALVRVRVRVAGGGGGRIGGSATRDTQAQGFKSVRGAEDAELQSAQVLRHDCTLKIAL